ncbi:hypothetical protein K458DRAFT_389864 [Lentithecium fluviatile CBS 122367]|uniref:Uncharacterized protein n=1 Tax=Lentithecium fluviatile CBS 122367 TaxID=1168545 RepID=A0A6G1IYB6_9PLEO|nr:hypothetical protein K458DRAFT_389864 [Lentithecium fluviatile CBS 122367]
MKSSSIIASALCNIASASPLGNIQTDTSVELSAKLLYPPQKNTQMYNLQVKSDDANYNGSYATYTNASRTSVYPIYTVTKTQAAATKFEFYNHTAQGNPRFSAYALDDRQEAALMGPGPAGELLYLVNAGFPTSKSIPAGMLMEWATFIAPNNVLGVDDGSLLTRRTFVVVEGANKNNTIALWDGSTRTWDDIVPITLNLVKACKWKVDCPESVSP